MTKAFVEISLLTDSADRVKTIAVYNKYRKPFLDTVAGARSKELLTRDEDVQVLLGFDTIRDASAYLSSKLFTNNVVTELKPLLKANPEIRIYTVAM